MDKTILLQQLRTAKSAHIQWRARAQAMVNGLALDENAVPVLHTDCKFGKWYYGPGQMLNHLPAYHEIDEIHEKLHLTYMEIFKCLFGDDDRSKLSKVFGSTRKHETAKLKKAETLLPVLVDISKDLLATIEMLESQVRALPEEELQKLA